MVIDLPFEGRKVEGSQKIEDGGSRREEIITGETVVEFVGVNDKGCMRDEIGSE